MHEDDAPVRCSKCKRMTVMGRIHSEGQCDDCWEQDGE